MVQPQHNRMNPAHWISLNLLEKLVSELNKQSLFTFEIKKLRLEAMKSIWMNKTTYFLFNMILYKTPVLMMFRFFNI